MIQWFVNVIILFLIPIDIYISCWKKNPWIFIIVNNLIYMTIAFVNKSKILQFTYFFGGGGHFTDMCWQAVASVGWFSTNTHSHALKVRVLLSKHLEVSTFLRLKLWKPSCRTDDNSYNTVASIESLDASEHFCHHSSFRSIGADFDITNHMS